MPSDVSVPDAVQAREPTNDELKRELAGARDQQRATSEILRIISISPSNTQPVFAEIAKSSARLCDAYDAIILLKDGDVLRNVAHEGPLPTDRQVPLTRDFLMGRAVLERRTAHVADLQAEVDEYPEGSEVACRLGHRTMLAVPIIRAGEAIGVVALRRLEKRPFSDRQIELLCTFADQAVIAIENARLFEAEKTRTKELTESLEYQTATSEVLSVISKSPNNLQPVLDAIVVTAQRLCQAEYTQLFSKREGDGLYHIQASVSADPQFVDWVRAHPIAAGDGSLVGIVAAERQTMHFPDCLTEPRFTDLARQQQSRARTMLGVPLLRGGEAIGVIFLARTVVRPFTDRQIALVTTFANQAVVAIENARLFEAEQASKRELTEALAQQTATADVLKVISRSALDLQRVLDALVESAARLCNAYDAVIYQVVGDGLRLVAHHGQIPLARPVGQLTLPLVRELIAARTVIDRRTIQVADILTEADKYPESWKYALQSGFRTALSVPLVHAGEAVGVILIRRTEVRPFTERQIGLVNTFADQAVIAIENTRLFEAEQASKRELQDSLEYQTATSEVLDVISRSPTDVQPVFDTIARSAARLCSALNCLVYRFDGKLVHFAAADGVAPEVEESARSQYPLPPGRASAATRAILNGAIEEIPDVEADPDYDHKAGAKLSNYRSIVAVPMLKDGCPIGAIAVTRSQVGRFPRRQIELLQTFADQAVIAIDNSRLFEAEQAKTREVEEALEIQTATAGILRVIASSPSDLAPVLSAVAESAAHLCDASDALVLLRKGDELRTLAHHGPIPAHAGGPIARDWVIGRAFVDRTPLQVADLAAAGADFPRGHAMAVSDGFRTSLAVPLMQRQGEAVGVICIRRIDVRPFTEKQIALLQTFADQAVIAIENARLFEEVQARTRELQESLEYQTATSNVLNVISRSPTDVQPVFDTIAKNAAQLCGAPLCNVFQFDGQIIHIAASQSPDARGVTLEALEANANQPAIQPGRGSAAARAIATNSIAEIPDIDADPEYELVDIARVAKLGSTMAVPMLKDGRPIGAIALGRFQKGRFPERQIELLRTFADQAVIAVANTRLFAEVQARNTELRVALEQQTATSELLKVIGRSTFDLQPVFETLAENAVRLCEAEHAFIFLYDGRLLRSVASHNIPPALRAFVEANPTRPGRESAAGRAAIERRTIHIEDIRSDPEFTYGVVHVGPMRTVLAIPMLRADELLGVIVITRPEVRLFTNSQIALMETFADQAVIAIENARLFEEVQARNRDLTALGEVGQAVSSTLDLKVVLKTIVDRAVELSGTDGGSIFYYRGGRFELGETTGLNEEAVARFRQLDIAEGQTGLGEAIAQRQPLQVPDIFQRPSNPLRDATIEAGLRAGLVVPLFSSEGPLGALVLQRRRPGEFPPAVVSLMQSFADQSAIALENARLFDEIAQKSRELEIASQHKSQFVANMSHELRTPLAAILGYAELMQEGFYEPLGQKSLDALTRIRSNGKHLLGLINTVLDIAKIESGQFTLNMAEYAIESVVETVRSATESLAQNKKLALKTDVAKSLPIGLGDEQRLTQVLLNLVGNAIKFTETGEVRVIAKSVNGHFNVSVADTGPGIPKEHQARIFEQFHQVDSSNTKAKGGTGLGLAIAKQIVEMHGGRIWVESTLGKGSTFQMELPTRAEFRKMAP